MEIKEARKVVGKTNIQYSDAEILDFMSTAELFKDIFIDQFNKLTPKELKKFK